MLLVPLNRCFIKEVKSKQNETKPLYFCFCIYVDALLIVHVHVSSAQALCQGGGAEKRLRETRAFVYLKILLKNKFNNKSEKKGDKLSLLFLLMFQVQEVFTHFCNRNAC